MVVLWKREEDLVLPVLRRVEAAQLKIGFVAVAGDEPDAADDGDVPDDEDAEA